jgi:hypothetical protein
VTVWQRAGGGILALVLGLLAWAFVAGAVDLADARICGDAAATVESLLDGGELECYDGSGVQRTAGVVIGVAAGVGLAAAAVVAFMFAVTGRRRSLLARLTVAAVALALLAIVVVAV